MTQPAANNSVMIVRRLTAQIFPASLKIFSLLMTALIHAFIPVGNTQLPRTGSREPAHRFFY
jgi:hypothetical protein